MPRVKQSDLLKSNAIRNRIVGHGEADPLHLLANEMNARTHPPRQQLALNNSLDKVGWLDEVIINKRASQEWGVDRGVETVVDGHLRIESAITRGEATIPVKYVDLSPEEERYALMAFDRITELATWDASQLDALLKDGVDPSVLFDQDELSELLNVVPNVTFPEYDETAADDVKYCICPNCGHKFPQ